MSPDVWPCWSQGEAPPTILGRVNTCCARCLDGCTMPRTHGMIHCNATATGTMKHVAREYNRTQSKVLADSYPSNSALQVLACLPVTRRNLARAVRGTVRRGIARCHVHSSLRLSMHPQDTPSALNPSASIVFISAVRRSPPSPTCMLPYYSCPAATATADWE